MISPLALERTGSWRTMILSGIFLLAIVPVMPLAKEWHGFLVLNQSFIRSIWASVEVSIAVTFLSLLFGLPAGLFASLWKIPAKHILLNLISLPLFVPSFLWAIGLSNLGFNFGKVSTCWVFLALGLPFTLFATYSAAIGITNGQVQSARLAGGNAALFFLGARAVFPIALIAAILSGILSLSDPGPAQIFGVRSAASEILISFSSLYDFAQAGRQCLLLALFTLFLILPLSTWAAPRLASSLLARDTDSMRPIQSSKIAWIGAVILITIAVSLILVPAAGLILSALHGDFIFRAIKELWRTAENTIFYAAGAGVLATLFAFFIALAIGRKSSRRIIVITCMLVFFSLPSALLPLGWISWVSLSPPALDFLVRSRFSVCLALALRLLPLATLLLLRSYGMTSITWTQVAAIHGIPAWKFLRKVIVPQMAEALVFSFLSVSALATAEVGTVLLLRPPGEDSFTISIVTIMANAPESFVSALCLLYFCGVVFTFSVVRLLSKRLLR